MIPEVTAPATINIRFGTPNGALSNLTERHFTIDGVRCASMEGWLQSLKYADIEKQKYCCTLTGHRARNYGRQAPDWRKNQTLFWNGVAYDRHSEEYQNLLDRAYVLLFTQNREGRKDLLATGNAKLVHTIGRSDPKETILTEREFCDRLMWIRDVLQSREFIK